MTVLIIVGVVLAVSFVVNWIRSDATTNPKRQRAAMVSALSLGGLVLICAVTTIGQLASPI